MKRVYFLLFGILIPVFAYAQELKQEIDLSGEWQFEIGDNMRYAKISFDDTKWDPVTVPDCWENAGYPGYDGFAWYRRWITLPEKLREKYLVLKLGRIDDADQVYLNGRFINGLGFLEPGAFSVANELREYILPKDFCFYGKKNLIAVRVYDHKGCGGIYDPPVGIYSNPEFSRLLKMDIAGLWKFKVGDSASWSKKDYDDSQWIEITAPCEWEWQGFPNLDGFCWYRKHFALDTHLRGESLILVLGKINDMDEVFFNGVRIGRTGAFTPVDLQPHGTEIWQTERFYFIPPHLINWEKENVVAIRVFDVWRAGGIWQGPLGITTREEYLHYIAKKERDEQ